MSDIYFANSHGQTLKSHSLAVAKRAKELAIDLNSRGRNLSPELLETIYLSGLFHDFGKISESFQRYLSSKSDADDTDLEEQQQIFPYHQELSYIFLNIHFGRTGKAISYSAYWHHPAPINEAGEIRQKLDETILSYDDLKEFINKCRVFLEDLKSSPLFCKDHLSSKFLTLKELDLDFVEYPTFPQFIERAAQSGEINYRETSLNLLITTLLIEADRKISALSATDLEKYLNGDLPLTSPWIDCEFLNELMPITSDRSLAQFKVAKASTLESVSVIGCDPGDGKTRISLKIASLNKEKLIIALPKRRLVEGMFSTVIEDANGSFPVFYKQLSVVSFHSGSIIKSTQVCDKESDQDLIQKSDVAIFVFDKVFASIHDRKKTSDLLFSFGRTLIIDEFHEAKDLPHMWPALRLMIQIRSTMGARTVLVSGTPDPLFCEIALGLKNGTDGVQFIDRDDLPESRTTRHKYFLSNRSSSELNTEKDTIYFLNSITACQKLAVRNKDLFILHSDYTKDDLDEKIGSLQTLFGKQSGFNGSIVCSKLATSSFDISRKNAFREITSHNDVWQSAGRHDRWGKCENMNFEISLNVDSKIFSPFGMDCAESVKALRSYLMTDEALGYGGDSKVLTKREFFKLYDNLFQYQQFIQAYKKELIERKKESEDFKDNKAISIVPVRAGTTTKLKSSTGNSGSIFRDGSLHISILNIGDSTLPDLEYETLNNVTEDARGSISNVIVSMSGGPASKMLKRFHDEVKKIGVSKISKAFSKDHLLDANIKNLSLLFKYNYPHYALGSEVLPVPVSHSNSDLDLELKLILSEYRRVYSKTLGVVKMKPKTQKVNK